MSKITQERLDQIRREVGDPFLHRLRRGGDGGEDAGGGAVRTDRSGRTDN